MSDLNKALSNIVGSLTELLSKISEKNVRGSSTQVRKTSKMTYHQFLSKVLAGRDPIQVVNNHQAFQLQEDLQLLLDLSEASNISVKTFQSIANSKRIQRSTQVLQRRYYETLSKIEEKDMKKITNWVQSEGPRGFLSFVGSELFIQRNQSAKTIKRKRPVSLDKEGKEEGSRIRNLKVPSNCKQLNDSLQIYSKMVDVPVKTLLQKLHQCSGDLNQLDRYIETKDARILWTQAEDQILRKKGPEIQILKRYRGSAIDARKKYLGIN